MCGFVELETMGLNQCVSVALLVVVIECVFGASSRSSAYRYQNVVQDSQEVDARGRWLALQATNGVRSLRQQSTPLSSNLLTSNIQFKQDMTNPTNQLFWKFPVISEEPAQPHINFELVQPESANSVAALCLENGVQVEVKLDFFGTGQLLEPTLFSLGGCAAVDMDAEAGVLIFQSALQDCGSQQFVTEDELVYLFAIEYTAAPFQGTSVIRASSATVDIECHYPRKHNVSSDLLQPAWVPFASSAVAEEVLVFSLTLMTADWMYERPSSVFFLGDVLNFCASVKPFNHVPLRIFVDHCVATANQDMSSGSLYSFIENHGCFTDAKYTGSSSTFLPRVENDQLQFQLESFRFENEGSGDIFITCFLKASIADSQIDGLHKACSFKPNGWISSDGSDVACGCCDSSCEVADVPSASPGGPFFFF
ncbi:hypothetical protein DNTS_026554 [Danionella cerebrum]|uniref:Zona pellucida sperm-binding protein 3 n=1 Tax=Danionella cerebrum TaxID=2873325 RepID=A0A553R9R5_9TELE|nr:hypothetical protein DNTS_026554 [Danionella translucida]